MAFQATSLNVGANSVNFIEGRRQLMEAMADKLPHYAFFGEKPQHDGTKSVQSDWALFNAPATGDLQGVATDAQVRVMTSVAENTFNHFTPLVRMAQIDYESTGGPGQSGSLGTATKDFQIRRLMGQMMIEINSGFGSNYASVKKATRTARGTAGTPVTFFDTALNIGTGTPTAPTGYDASDEMTNVLPVDGSTGNQRRALGLRQIIRGASTLAGSLSGAYESQQGFAVVLRQQVHDDITTGSAIPGIGALNRVGMGSTNIGTAKGTDGLKINLTLVCIKSSVGDIYLIPTLEGHNLTAAANQETRVDYVTRPEFTAVQYAGNWEDSEVLDSARVIKPVVRCLFTYYPPPKEGGLVFQGQN